MRVWRSGWGVFVGEGGEGRIVESRAAEAGIGRVSSSLMGRVD
jgi:hypothetical protein